MKRSHRCAVFLLTFAVVSGAQSQQGPLEEVEPNPALSPGEVVRIQLLALKRNDVPYANAGIELTYRFASPANKAATGPLDRFVQLLQTPMYASMLNFREAEYLAVDQMGEYAEQRVILTARDGVRVGYLFSLSRQREGAYQNCWMTDSVVPFSVGQQGATGTVF